MPILEKCQNWRDVRIREVSYLTEKSVLSAILDYSRYSCYVTSGVTQTTIDHLDGGQLIFVGPNIPIVKIEIKKIVTRLYIISDILSKETN